MPEPDEAGPTEEEAQTPGPDTLDREIVRAVEIANEIRLLRKQGPKESEKIRRLQALIPNVLPYAKGRGTNVVDVFVEEWFPARAGRMTRAMLDESDRAARHEGSSRYRGSTGKGDAQQLQTAARILAPAEKRYRDLWLHAGDVLQWEEAISARDEFEGLRNAYAGRYPILRAPKVNYEKLAAADQKTLERLVGGLAAGTLRNIAASRENLDRGRLSIWDLDPVIARMKEFYGIAPGSAAYQVIDNERADRARSRRIISIATGVLQIGLGVAAVFASGGVALVAALGGAVISGAQAIEEAVDYDITRAARGSDIDAARAISAEDPSLFWLAASIVGAVTDLGGAVKAFRAVAQATGSIDALRQAALAEGAVLEQAGQIKGTQPGQMKGTAEDVKGTAEDFAEGIVRAASTAKRRVVGRAKTLTELLQGTSGRVANLLAKDEKTMTTLLREYGSWKELITALESGTPDMKTIATHLVEFRGSIVRKLARPTIWGGVGAQVPLGKASTEAVSDVDLWVKTGAELIQAEAHMARRYGKGWQEMLRMAFLTEGSRVYKYADIIKSLPRAARAALQKRVTDAAEKLNFARMLRHAGKDRKAVARVDRLMRKVVKDPDDVALIRRLAAFDQAKALAKRDELLREVDALVVRFDAADGAGKVQLAEEITKRQMAANFFMREAYISPGAVREAVVEGLRLTGPEAYQSALAQLEMIEHVLHEAGGDIVKACRDYEIFKYISRFAAVSHGAGVRTTMSTYLENLSEYIYRTYRRAHAEIPPGLPDDWLRSPRADRFGTPFPKVGDEFLRSQFDHFRKAAEDALPKIKRQAMRDPAVWAEAPAR